MSMTHQKQCRTASIKLVSIHNRKSLEKEKEKDMDVSVLVFQTYINLLIAASKTTKPLTKKSYQNCYQTIVVYFCYFIFPFIWAKVFMYSIKSKNSLISISTTDSEEMLQHN